MLGRVFAAFAVLVSLIVSFSAPAKAAKLCGWMVESEDPDDVRKLKIFLSSDADVDFFYRIGGKGIVYPGNAGNSPGSGTFTLHPGQTDSPWSYGQTLEPPGQIDVNIEIHQTPADIFSDKPTPLWANFVFRRNVPAAEKNPPATFMKKQCATVPTTPH
ncbi:MAG TPA: hypothetical protein VMD53_06715 [Rhizomicrobium sp.]|nr:hypothetical protein [Rhizomicrobium sp.]